MVLQICAAAAGRAGGRAPAGPAAVDQGRAGRAGGRGDAGGDPEGRDPLVASTDGGTVGVEQVDDRSDLAAVWAQTAPGRELQAVDRPAVCEKVVDVVGLYHHPPDKAVVLCVDEKAQIQALDRSQPVLPMMPGMPE